MICVLTIENVEKPNKWVMCGEEKSVRKCPNRFGKIINNADPSDFVSVIGFGHENWMTFYFYHRNEMALGGEYVPPVYREIQSCKYDVMVGLDGSMFLHTVNRIRTYMPLLGSVEIEKTKVKIYPAFAFANPIIFDSERCVVQGVVNDAPVFVTVNATNLHSLHTGEILAKYVWLKISCSPNSESHYVASCIPTLSS